MSKSQMMREVAQRLGLPVIEFKLVDRFEPVIQIDGECEEIRDAPTPDEQRGCSTSVLRRPR